MLINDDYILDKLSVIFHLDYNHQIKHQQVLDLYQKQKHIIIKLRNDILHTLPYQVNTS
jgi:hypothetical protein